MYANILQRHTLGHKQSSEVNENENHVMLVVVMVE